MATQKIKVRGAKALIAKEVIPFTRQMASMTKAGMTILSTIQTLEEQSTNPEFKKVLRHLLTGIEGGVPLSAALKDVPQLFDDMYVHMVEAGEQSGKFEEICERLALTLQSGARLRKKVKSAMTYPTVIISIATIMALALIQFVVPIFAEMFNGFGKKLPALTQALVDVSDFGKRWWYVIIPGIIAAVWLFGAWKKTASGRLTFDEWMLKVPVFGQLNLKSGISRFCRIFAQMLNAGVPVLNAMDIVAGSIGNRRLEMSIRAARREVEQGNQISPSLGNKPYMPVLMTRMIAAGEKSGRVGEMLDSVADTYDDEVESTLSTLTSLMEPFLMVFLGAVIGTIVLAMFMPIFNLGSLAK